jgi:ATP-binding cassette, subfamily B, bacterial
MTNGEGREPPRLELRRLPLLVAGALRLAWAAAPRELAVQAGLLAVAGLGLVVPILAGRDLLAALAAGAAPPALVVPALLVVVVLGVTNLAALVAGCRDELLSELLSRHAHRQILRVAAGAELARFEEPGFHDRLQRAMDSADLRPYQLAQGIGALLQALLATVGVAVALGAIEPVLMVVALAVVGPLWVAGVRTGQVMFGLMFRLTAAERERAYLARLLTQRQPAAEVRAYGLGSVLRRRWERRTDERIVEVGRTVRERLRITVQARLFSGAALGALLAALAGLGLTGRMNVADAAAAAGAVLLLTSRLRAAAIGTDLLFEAAPFVADLRTFVAQAFGPEQTPPPAAATFQRLTVEDLTFAYPSATRPALCGVDLEIRAGEVVALVGANGSGKSTLAKLLCQLYQPQRGRIRYDGVDVSGTDPGPLRASIGVLFQDFQRYLFPAGENIAMGRWERAGDAPAVAAAAAAAGADRFVATLPDGYGTRLGPEFDGGTDLSGGQWQRIAVARAFFRDAPFVILDEPTAALDARAEFELFETIRELLAGRTVLLISHRFSTVRSADRIYVLAHGRVIESGNHSELMRLDGRYAEMFTLQAAPYLAAP